MAYQSLKEIIDAIHNKLGLAFCKQLAQERKMNKNAGRIVRPSIIFEYDTKHPDWAISKGGGLEVQFYIDYKNGVLSYGLGFNAQHVQFANAKKPSEYIRPYSDAFVSLWDAHDSDIEALKTEGATVNIQDLRQVKDGTFTYFGIRGIPAPIDTSIIDGIAAIIRNYLKPLYLKVLSMGTATSSLGNIFPLVALLKNNYNLILSGAPGTGKTYTAREIAAAVIGCAKNALNGHPQFGFVQFHPSYDYTDFVEGLRPKDDGNGKIVFERKDGVFKSFCAKAAIAEQADLNKSEKRLFVFVIDEINRGEISKVFGELFFSIDPGYRKVSDRIPVNTQYQNLIKKGERVLDHNGNDIGEYLFDNGFYVPENVFIIGTVNDIDRSVEIMDFAFRRRFAFKEILAKDTQTDILQSCKFKDDAIRKMDNLNFAIDKQGLGASYHIGASYFMKIDDYKGNWESLWENHLKGVLYEYLRGLPNASDILDSWKKEYEK